MSDLPLDPDAPDPVDAADGPATDEDAGSAGDSLVDRLRGTGVGVEDPNIIGDAGPTDVAPGRDPDGGLFAVDPDGEPPPPA